MALRHLPVALLVASILSAPQMALRIGAQEPAAPPPPTQQPAQQPEGPIATLTLKTNLVAVQAVVLDSRGDPVRGLTKDDFSLKQDGKPQEIRYFSQDSDLPLTLALMVDTSGSQRAFIEDEIEASEKFFRVMLTRKNDRAVLVQFDFDVLRLQPMTTNVQALENALRFLSMAHRPTQFSHGSTLLYDAIVATSQVALNSERGRRAMVILTDGEDNGSRYTMEQAIAAAQRADIVVYSVLYSMKEGEYPRMSNFSGRDRGKDALTSISNATGGRVFVVGPKMPLDLIYSQIADDMRLQYQIGYTPPESKPGEYHKIELKPTAKHLTVQARQGYYSPR
jgi:Ca-activated chloride channel family protein